MSEIILTFQTQLSGVMETVFKAAIFEITRLVEDSFLDEVSRNREQVETLKKRLQWSESRGRRRCADCGNSTASNEERKENERAPLPPSGEGNSQNLKQEERVEQRWENCGVKKNDSCAVMVEPEDASSPVIIVEHSVREKESLRCILKSEAVQTSTGTEPQVEWKINSEVPEGSVNSAHDKTYSEQELQQIQDEWSSGLDQATEPQAEPDMHDIQGLLYRSRYGIEDLGSYGNQELGMGEINGIADSTQRAREVLGYSLMAGSMQTDQGMSEDCRRRTRTKRGNKGSHSTAGTSDCLLINEEGYLQNMSSLPQASGAVAGASQVHSLYSKDTVTASSNCFYSENAFSQPLAPNRCAEMLGSRDERVHNCSQCMINFSDQASLKAHMKAHSQPKMTNVHVCNQCGKKFPQACNLKVHQRVHVREGLHLCNHCGKGFVSFGDLRRHRCIPTEDKPYMCTLCGNKFRRLWNLKLHRRIHTQEKPHRCSMCDKSFTRADILKIHQRTHTGERPYSCRVCGLTFKRLDHLRSHQRKHPNLNNH